jgi:hypothetical protein
LNLCRSEWAQQLEGCLTQAEYLLQVDLTASGDVDTGVRLLAAAAPGDPASSIFTEVGILRTSFARRDSTAFTFANVYKTVSSVNDADTCAQLCAADAANRCLTWTLNIVNQTCALHDEWSVPQSQATAFTAGVAAGKTLFGAFLRREHASVTQGASTRPRLAPIYYNAQNPEAPAAQMTSIDLRVVVDHSIVEVFASASSAVLTARVYPSPDACQSWVFNHQSVNRQQMSVQLWPLVTPAVAPSVEWYTAQL